MKLALKTKYKTRKPEQTVKILQDFFTSEGFVYNINSQTSEAGTWSCRIEIFKNDYYFMGANGKGMSEIYSLASGFAELYERYCNRCPFDLNIFYNLCNTNKLLKQRGYVYHPDEHPITIEEILQHSYVSKYFENYSTNPEIMRLIVQNITNHNPIGVPYKNLFDDIKETLYMDPRILMDINGSQGMAAGNSLEEAIIQANAELWEKYVGWFFFQDDFEQYHSIDLSSINNPELTRKINTIKSCGYNFYVIDLSYNYSLPVLMSILIDRSLGQIRINFGSFPVFDIALERIITELYQGIYTFKSDIDMITPYKTNYKDEIIAKYSATCSTNFFPESFFNKTVISKPNLEVFIDRSQNISSLLQYCKERNALKGYDIYWVDKSISKDFFAIQLFCPQLHLSYYVEAWSKQEFANANFKIVFQILEIYSRIIQGLLKNEYIFEDYQSLYSYQKDYPKDFDAAHIILFVDPFNMQPGKEMLRYLSILTNPYIDIGMKLSYFSSLYNYSEYRKYSLLNSYASTKEYKSNEILAIMNIIFNFSITEDEIEQALKGSFLIQKIFYEPIYKFVQAVYLT